MQVAGAINSNTRAVSKARPSWSRENVGKFFFKDAYPYGVRHIPEQADFRYTQLSMLSLRSSRNKESLKDHLACLACLVMMAVRDTSGPT